MVLISILAIAGASYLWVHLEYSSFNKLKNDKLAEYYQNRKEYVKEKTLEVASDITQMKSSAMDRLKTRIQSRTEEAYLIAMNIYNNNKDKSKAELRKMIHDALFAASWDDGKGYYFAEDMQGNEIINRNNPDLEGKNIINLKDSKGILLVQDIIKVAKSEKGEGFVTYHWNKPGAPDILLPKYSYVKYFAPLDWVIGNGAYVHDEILLIQEEVLNRVKSLEAGDDGYVFIGTYDGTLLTYPDPGVNHYEAEDANGVKLIQELIHTAKTGGGFVNYVMPKWGNETPGPKTSYCVGIQDWEWFVGTGVYINEIEAIIDRQAVQMHDKIKYRIIIAFSILFLFLLLSFIFTKILSYKLAYNLRIFGEFFDKATHGFTVIPEDKVTFSEFRPIAQAANDMIEKNEITTKENNALSSYLSSIINSMPSILVAVNSEGNITQWNNMAEKITDIKAEMARGKKLENFFPQLGFHTDEIKNALQTKNMLCIEEIKHIRNGQEVVEDITIFPLEDVGIEGAVIRIDDVTDRSNLEEQLAHSKKMDAIGQLAGGIAHDFNNMLGGIMGAAELIQASCCPNIKCKKYTRMIVKTTEHAAELVGKLLMFSRKTPIKSEAIDGMHPLEEAVNILERTLDKKITIQINHNAESSIISGDFSSLQNAFINLGINASHAMPKGGELSFTTKNTHLDSSFCNNSSFLLTPGKYLEIEVKDTGCGIHEARLSRIFEPFFTTKDQGQGTGLGLAAVYGTIQQHKGAITVESEVEIGTTFKIFLPLITKDEQPTEDTIITTMPTIDVPPNGQCVLIVDDEEVIRETAEILLNNLGYRTICAENGLEAIEIFQEHHQSINLVLLDMIMPEMDGRVCFNAMRLIDPNAKIILASGFTRDTDITDLRENGLKAFIRKPYHLKELNRVLSTVLQDEN